MSEPGPPNNPLERKTRLPFETPTIGGSAVQQGAVVIYALVTVALIAVALYMALVERLPVLSGWVVAPAIGAIWFGLRLFMILGSRR